MYLNMRLWQYYPVEMPVNKDGDGPIEVREADEIHYEVWDRSENVYSSHKQLSDAINSAIDLNLMNDPNFLLPSIKYSLDMIEGAFGLSTSPIITRDDEGAMSIENIKASYVISPVNVQKTILALAKYATVANAIQNTQLASLEVEVAALRLERDQYYKSLQQEIAEGKKLAEQLAKAEAVVAGYNGNLSDVAATESDISIDFGELEAELAIDLNHEDRASALSFDTRFPTIDYGNGCMMVMGNLDKSIKPYEPENKHLGINLEDLIAICQEWHGLTPDQVLGAATSLYEKNLITYPRTESRHLTSDMLVYGNLRNRLSAISLIPGTLGLIKKLDLSNISSVWVHDGADHHAIIPTDRITENELLNLSVYEKDVFYTVYTAFLGLFKPENRDKGFVAMADQVRDTINENEKLKQQLNSRNDEIKALVEERDNAARNCGTLAAEIQTLQSENAELNTIRDQYETSLKQADQATAGVGDSPFDVDLNDMESHLTASLQDELLTGAQLALSPRFTKARCQYLMALLSDINGSQAAAAYEVIRDTVGAVTSKYVDFCEMDFQNDFDEKLANRDNVLAGIETIAFALKEVVDNLNELDDSKSVWPSADDVKSDIGEFTFNRLGEYNLHGLPTHLRGHWAAIKSRIE